MYDAVVTLAGLETSQEVEVDEKGDQTFNYVTYAATEVFRLEFESKEQFYRGLAAMKQFAIDGHRMEDSGRL